MLEMYLFETTQNMERIEELILASEQSDGFTDDTINEIFRLMHTIKGSSAMMLFNHISTLAHSIEDVFFFLREQHPQNVDFTSLNDLVLEGIDFMKVEIEKIKNGDKADGDADVYINNVREFLKLLKQNNLSNEKIETPITDKKQQYYIQSESVDKFSKNIYKATIFFTEDCEMEHIRAYAIINQLQEYTEEIYHLPEDLIENEQSMQIIREQGFVVFVKINKSYEEMYEFFNQTTFLKDLQFEQLEDEAEFKLLGKMGEGKPVIATESPEKVTPLHMQEGKEIHGSQVQSIISVNVTKLDKLMDLVGEMVIAEAMVTQNPDLAGLELDNFYKASRQLHKITTEIQDMVMSVRMVPLATTFHKMHRIVRDMSKKMNKEVKLQIIGEETEVDKNIIEHISDPLMHLVRNSIDHGIEISEEREGKGKPKVGTVTLEAKNSGSNVLLIISDDGKGLNKRKLLEKAKQNNLLMKPESEMTDKEIYNLIFVPGFSTKEHITEFSGRGVGLDVVVKNIEAVGGVASIDSIENVGTTVTLKIPLTLAIIDGMNVRVGHSRYTIPITAIKESFKPERNDLIIDPDGNEMIMVRGECYSILRLHEFYGVKNTVTDISEGILIMVEQDNKIICLFADELVGQQQVVVKAMPNYIRNKRIIKGLTGCTLLGDGSISLILDVGGLINRNGQQDRIIV